MNKQNANQQSERDGISAEAAAWFAKLQGPGRTPAALAAFKEWLAESPAHAQAFDSVTDVWEILPGAVIAHSGTPRIVSRRATYFKVGTLATAMAASVALLFVLLTPSSENAVYSTAIGEQRSVMLPDGSYVALNTDTTVTVSYHDGERDVVLESGEAAFEVAKDKSRPFVVSVAGERVTALGTKFNIRKESLTATPKPETQIAVTLIEGRVEVARPSSFFGVSVSPEHIRVLEPGERVTVGVAVGKSGWASADRAASMVVDRPNLKNLMAWQHGEIMFDNAPMVAVVAEFNRYGGKQILLGDSSLGKLSVSGVFNIRHTDDAVELIAETHGLRVVNGFDNALILQR